MITGFKNRGEKITSNALRDKDCPSVNVARFIGKDLAVNQGVSGWQEKMEGREPKSAAVARRRKKANRKQEEGGTGDFVSLRGGCF